MIELRLNKTTLRLDFSFFAVLSVFLLYDRLGTGIAALCACISHELSHLIVMRYFGIRADSVTLYGAGIKISSEETERAAAGKQLAVFAAGSLMNLALAAAFALLGHSSLAVINLLTGLFNLLPMGEFDGARILKLAVLRFGSPEKVAPAERLGNILSAAAVAVLVFAGGAGVSLTLITTAAYILAVVFLRI